MKYTLGVVTAVTLLLSGCKPVTEKQATLSEVVVDSVFTNRFLPAGNRFTGGDGTYSVELPDGRTVWFFGDSFIGNVTADKRRIKTTPAYIRNSFVVLTADSLITFQQGKPEEFKSMMIPPEVEDGSSGYAELDLWYWPGDGFVANNKLHVFLSKFYQEDHDDMWAFEFRGTELMSFTLPDFKPTNVYQFLETDSVHYGHALLETDDYLYIYGLKNMYPYVARVKDKKFTEPWEFYNGNEWVVEAKNATPMLEFSGSEQFSVFLWKDTYVMIMQEGDLSTDIYSFTSKTPYGPWENKQFLYRTPLPDSCAKCFTYNALAHPQFTENNMLLVSYNTNSMEMDDHYKNALIYRPRFIRVPIERIMPK